MEKLNSNDLLSTFSHEAISRVIPGLVVLTLYFHKYVVAALKLAHDSSILSILSILIAAWLIGAVIEKLVNFVIIPVAKKCGCSYLGDNVPEDGSQLMIYYLKYIAETAMFRAFWMISIVTVIVTPNIAFFTEREWNKWYGIIAFAVNFYVYYRLKFKSPYKK